MFLTEQFADFIAKTDFDDFPDDVVCEAKERIMDTVGAALAGSFDWEYADKVHLACKNLGSGSFSCIGSGEKQYAPAVAAMIDSMYAHSVELDDGHKNAGCHAGAVVVPSALVMGQALKKSGKEVLTAVVLGYEVIYRIASKVNPSQINKGFHPSSNCDVYGAMVVAGKLMGLSRDKLANGLGQAGMLASGTMEATRQGQRSKCVQVGHAAYNGIFSAYLAQAGMEGCLSALEGKYGMFATQSENVDSEDIVRDLGRIYSIKNTYNKLYPSCRHAQPGIEAVLDLAAEYNIQPEDVDEIQIGTHKVAYDLTGIIKAPKDSGQAKFSLAYGTAAALFDHSFNISHLKPAKYTDPRILALAERVNCRVDPEVQAVYPRKRGARVEIILKNGKKCKKELYDLKGSPDNPIGWSQLEQKFRLNALVGLPQDNVSGLVSCFNAFDSLSGMDPVMELLH